MRSIDGWGVLWPKVGFEKAATYPPTRRFRADLPLKGGGAAES